jgi:BolA family transcriptional regulator, general stress-responsive regulator
MSRIEKIRAALNAALAPVELHVIDDSHKHAGHEGAKSGLGHFSIEIVSAAFVGKKQLQRHRMVYLALGELMQTDIHAVAITPRTPQEI